MKKRNRVSNLSMAAIAILAAALPCVAQDQLKQTHRDAAHLLAAPGSGVTLALNRSSINFDATPVTSTKNTGAGAIVKSPLTLTAANFTGASKLTQTEDLFSTGSQMKVNEATKYDFKQQFVGIDKENKKNRVEFVPSRGPWNMK